MRWTSTTSSTPLCRPKKGTSGVTGKTTWRIWRRSFSVSRTGLLASPRAERAALGGTPTEEVIHETHNILSGGSAAGGRGVADGPARGRRHRQLFYCGGSLCLRRHGAAIRTARVHVARDAAALRGE